MNNGSNVNIDRKKNFLERFLLLMPLGNGTAEEALLLWLMVSVWVHYVASGALLVILFFVVLFNPKMRKKLMHEKNMFFIGAMIGLYSFLVSAIAKNLIGLAISLGVFFIISLGAFAKSVMTESLLQKISGICCVGSIISAGIAIYQKFFKYGFNYLYRPTAHAFNANYYGTLTVMTMIICVYNVLDGKGTACRRAKNILHRLFYAVAFLINFAMLMISKSRSSLMAFMICAIFYLLITKRYLWFIVSVIVAIGVVTVGWFFPDVFSWTNSLMFSITERSAIWVEALKSFSQNPYTAILGRGPMTYYLVKGEEGLFDAMHSHNLYVDMLINVGIIGTVMYLILFAYLSKEIIKAWKADNKTGVILATLFVFEILVQGIPDVTIMWHQSGLLFMLIIASVGAEKSCMCAEERDNGKQL